MKKYNKKLIEVALPLEAINNACISEGSPFTPRHPRSLHVYWARRRLAVARAVIFAQMVDDPSSYPNLFSTEQAQEKERNRLFKIIEDLVLWENTTNESVLQPARDEIWKSWRRTCLENSDHPLAKELFDQNKLPAFYDPFAGGGALPLEAQRLGLESYASDSNPVAVLINKAMIEIPPKFANRYPVNPKVQLNLFRQNKQKEQYHSSSLFAIPSNTTTLYHGTQGLAEDVLYYGQWMRDEAKKRIGHLYPKITITAEIAGERPDLQSLLGSQLTVIAWLWVRTVKSPNPAFSQIDVPLTSTFQLSTKPGKEAYVVPIIKGDDYHFIVRMGKPRNAEAVKKGTKLTRGANFRCIMSGSPIAANYIYSEANSGRMGVRMMAIVAEGEHGRVYLPPTSDMEAIAQQEQPDWKPDVEMPGNPRWFSPPLYGLKTYGDLFTPRQLVALTTYSNLVQETCLQIKSDALVAGIVDDGQSLDKGGSGAQAYAEAVSVYLGLAISRWTDLFSTLSAWNSTNQNIKNLFSRQAIPMIWDFAESNPFGSGATFSSVVETIYKLFINLPAKPVGTSSLLDARLQLNTLYKVVSTDPPYYDNIGYADLSDFFYVWLRKSLKPIFPDLFATLIVPKVEELIADPYRHGSKDKAETFFLDGMTQAMHRIAEQAHPFFPITIYYAFKQSENDTDFDVASTGWETFLDAVISAGFVLTGTWPIRTERTVALKKHINALASSIVLVCRQRANDAPTATRREFINDLKSELPAAIALLQRGNIAPVDLAQSAIGPGMGVYTRYTHVLDAKGKPLSVREALILINDILAETLTEQEGDFDADTRWALVWFDQYGFNDSEYGIAETLSKAKNTSVSGMVDAGILKSGAGKVRLLRPEELPVGWDPTHDQRLTAWEMVHHLIRTLETAGEVATAELLVKIGSQAEIARELAYRLYTICERRKRAQLALTYNSLVQSWPEITRIARQDKILEPEIAQTTMSYGNEE